MLTEARNWVESLPSVVRAWKEWDLLSPDQLIAVYEICSLQNDCTLLTGRAGSGKSFVLQLCRKYLMHKGIEVYVTGVTGVASQNVEGQGTINKVFALGVGNRVPVGIVDLSRRGRKNTMQCSGAVMDLKFRGDAVVFIDEAGMMTAETSILIYEVIQHLKGKHDVKIVMFGDFRQLAPIKSQIDSRFTMHFNWLFHNAQFQAAAETTVRDFGNLLVGGPKGSKEQENWKASSISLITNHRQEEDDYWFVNALNALGDGENFEHPKVSKLLSRVYTRQSQFEDKYMTSNFEEYKEPTDAIHVFHNNRKVLKWNSEVLEELIKEGAEYREYSLQVRTQHRLWSREDLIKSVAPIQETQKLCVGSKFMVRMNLNEYLSNGTVGEIVEVLSDSIRLKLKDGSIHVIEETEFHVPEKDGKKVGFIKGLPGHPAHALTPWKLQGLTLKSPVVYHLTKSEWGAIKRGDDLHGLLYVVFSRVTNPRLLYVLADSMRLLNEVCQSNPVIHDYVTETENKMCALLGKKQKKPKMDVKILKKEEQGSKTAYYLDYLGKTYVVGYNNEQHSTTLVLEGNQWVKADNKVSFQLRTYMYELGKVATKMFTTISEGQISILDVVVPVIEIVEGNVITDQESLKVVDSDVGPILVIKDRKRVEEDLLTSFDKFDWVVNKSVGISFEAA